MAIIRSALDTDLYKFTMAQAAAHRFPGAHARYAFRCRTPGADLAPLAEAVRAEVDACACLRALPEEIAFLDTLGFLAPDFTARLASPLLDPSQVRIRPSPGGLDIRVEGPWHTAIFWEVPLLAIVQKLWMRTASPHAALAEGRTRLEAKVRALRSAPGVRFADFGTRRRFSAAWHDEVVATLARCLPGQFVGTSNVHLARTHALRPIGTMAHEYLQAAQALAPELRHHQRFALEQWLREYRGRLGIALTDVIGMDAFLTDFDAPLAQAYDGLRHDSGDPFIWGEKAIAHYERLGIDPREKQLVFSDGLDVAGAVAIAEHFRGRVHTSFGIGTHLTNDLGPRPLNIVIKLVRLNAVPVAKLSDAPGKTVCEDARYVEHLRQMFRAPARAAG